MSIETFNQPDQKGRVFLDMHRQVLIRFGSYAHSESKHWPPYLTKFLDDILALHAGLTECLAEMGQDATQNERRHAVVNFFLDISEFFDQGIDDEDEYHD